jgi:hypothetical protein
MLKNKMKNRKAELCLALCLALMLIAMPTIKAIGISPGRTLVNFEPGKEGVINFEVVNDEHKKMDVMIAPRGDADIEIYYNGNPLTGAVVFEENEPEKKFQYRFKLPQEMLPGLHETSITAIELPQESGKGIYVSASAGVATEFAVQKLYPGSYLGLDFNIAEGDAGGTTKFIVSASNLGEQAVKSAHAQIDIFDSGKKIKSLQTETGGIGSRERKDFTAEWKPEKEGKYTAKATMFFDGNSTEIEKSFDIGSAKLELLGINADEFKLGDIAKLELLVGNRWNEQLDNVYAELSIPGKAGIKSSFESIPALSNATLTIYWDTKGVKPGDYDGKLILHYANKQFEKDIRLHLEESSIRIETMGIAATISSERAYRAIFTFAGLAIAIIALILYLRKRKKY